MALFRYLHKEVRLPHDPLPSEPTKQSCSLGKGATGWQLERLALEAEKGAGEPWASGRELGGVRPVSLVTVQGSLGPTSAPGETMDRPRPPYPQAAADT